MMATMADAHREWHVNAGVPMGPTGGTCPWDACGWADPDCVECGDTGCEACHDPEAEAEVARWIEAQRALDVSDAGNPFAFV